MSNFYEAVTADLHAAAAYGHDVIASLARPERERFPKMGFNASKAVEPLDYDFSEFVPGCIGTIPEPSQAAMRDYQRALIKIQKRVQDVQPDEDAYAKLTAEELETLSETVEKITDEIDVITATLCKNKPSAKEVGKLPHRVKMAFATWLQEQFTPEALTSATK